MEARVGLANVPANCVQRRVEGHTAYVSPAATPLAVGVGRSLTLLPNVTPEDRGNVGLWDAAPLGQGKGQLPGGNLVPLTRYDFHNLLPMRC